MPLLTIVVLVLLILLVVGTSPTRWGYFENQNWGPSGGLGALVIVLIILWLFGVI